MILSLFFHLKVIKIIIYAFQCGETAKVTNLICFSAFSSTLHIDKWWEKVLKRKKIIQSLTELINRKLKLIFKWFWPLRLQSQNTGYVTIDYLHISKRKVIKNDFRHFFRQCRQKSRKIPQDQNLYK